jgi:hypothetical protein
MRDGVQRVLALIATPEPGANMPAIHTNTSLVPLSPKIANCSSAHALPMHCVLVEVGRRSARHQGERWPKGG